MASERWLKLPAVIFHEENDGWAFVKRGAEAVEKTMTWEEACRIHPSQASALLDEMRKVLDRPPE